MLFLHRSFNSAAQIRAIAKELDISRTPIREALKQLELEGLVESIPNKGVYVKGFSSRDIDDMFEIRLALEGLAIQLAIDRMDDMHLSKIREVYELMEFYTMKQDNEKISQLNPEGLKQLRKHREIIEEHIRKEHPDYYEHIMAIRMKLENEKV